MSEDLIRRSDAIEALGEEPYVWTDDDEFAMGERSQWIDDVSAIEAVSSVDTSEAKEYILSELSDLLEEYSELNENGLHDPKWCGVREAYGIVKNVPFVDSSQEWIPCSERLPDNDELMLVNYIDPRPEAMDIWIGWHEMENVWYIDGELHSNELGNEVIAWMPLPKPWKGVDNER